LLWRGIAVRAAAAANSGDVLLELDDDLLKLPCMSAGQSVLEVVGEDKDAKGTVVTPHC
jgi:hypothetical protein